MTHRKGFYRLISKLRGEVWKSGIADLNSSVLRHGTHLIKLVFQALNIVMSVIEVFITAKIKVNWIMLYVRIGVLL